MDTQDEFYLNNESDDFFDRAQAVSAFPGKGELRPAKVEIEKSIQSATELTGSNVLEIGCFIGDLLGWLKTEKSCTVSGVESSEKACRYAKENFDVCIEHATFSTSSFFELNSENRERFDIIICDDVLSWMERALILSAIGAIDWLLKPGGFIYIRDFSPTFAFAFENHHHLGKGIYNYKQPGGHRQFFLNSGNYLEISTEVRISEEYQKVQTNRPDAMVWSDSVLKKCEVPLHPRVEM